jgi:hypothetical protein
VELAEEIAVAVEEGAVHAGGSGDCGDAEILAPGGGVVEGFDDTLTSAGGVGAT